MTVNINLDYLVDVNLPDKGAENEDFDPYVFHYQLMYDKTGEPKHLKRLEKYRQAVKELMRQE